jgi:hypothetical protein
LTRGPPPPAGRLLRQYDHLPLVSILYLRRVVQSKRAHTITIDERGVGLLALSADGRRFNFEVAKELTQNPFEVSPRRG